MAIAFLMLCGCADTKTATPRKSAAERQNDALKDPFGYGPQDHSADPDSAKAKEDAAKKANRGGLMDDIDRFLNP